MMHCKGGIWFIWSLLVVSCVVVESQSQTIDTVEIDFNQGIQPIDTTTSARELLQSQECDQLVISITGNRGVFFEFEYRNGSNRKTQQKGAGAQFLSLEDVDRVTIIPDRSTDTTIHNTVILSTEEFSVDESANIQPSSTQTSTDNFMALQDVYNATVTPSPQKEVYQSPSGQLLKEPFSTLANVEVDNRDFDNGILIDNHIQTPSPSLPNYLAPIQSRRPTFQRGLPQPPTPSPIPATKSNNQQSGQLLQNIQIPLYIDFVTPENEDSSLNIQYNQEVQNISDNLNYQLNLADYNQLEMEIMSVNDDEIQVQSEIFPDEISVAAFKQSESLEQEENLYGEYSQTVILDEEQSGKECISMNELIKSNGGDLFALAIEVLDLKYESIGKIVSVFLPDPGAFEEYLTFLGIDLNLPSKLSLQQQQFLIQLVQYHIVPDVLLLNLASIATPSGTPLKTANNQIFNLGIENNNLSNVIIIPQNIEIVSTVPESACEGFLFKLNSILRPGDFTQSP